MAAVRRTLAFPALRSDVLGGFYIGGLMVAALIAVHRLRALRPRLE